MKKKVTEICLFDCLNTREAHAKFMTAMDSASISYKDTTVWGHYPSFNFSEPVEYDDLIKCLNQTGLYYLYASYDDFSYRVRVWTETRKWILDKCKAGKTYRIDYETKEGEQKQFFSKVVALAPLSIKGMHSPMRYGVLVSSGSGNETIYELKDWLKSNRVEVD